MASKKHKKKDRSEQLRSYFTSAQISDLSYILNMSKVTLKKYHLRRLYNLLVYCDEHPVIFKHTNRKKILLKKYIQLSSILLEAK